MFKFRCMHCDKKIVVPTEFSGRHVRCPGCAQSTIVPFPSPEELEAAEEVGFRIRANPSAALSSRTCKSCGATMPPSGPCIHCGADPGEGLKAAFDASLATMLAVPEPAAALTAPVKRRRPGASVIMAIAAVIAITLCAAAYYFLR
jgi:hypothetical protein